MKIECSDDSASWKMTAEFSLHEAYDGGALSSSSFISHSNNGCHLNTSLDYILNFLKLTQLWSYSSRNFASNLVIFSITLWNSVSYLSPMDNVNNIFLLVGIQHKVRPQVQALLWTLVLSLVYFFQNFTVLFGSIPDVWHPTDHFESWIIVYSLIQFSKILI